MEKYIKSGGRCITFGHINIKENKFDFSSIVGKSMFFYGKMENEIIMPISYGEISAMGVKTNRKIICNNKTHYREAELVWNKDDREIHWGKFFKIVASPSGEKSYINIEIQGNLKERMRDLLFLFDLIKTKEFYFKDDNFISMDSIPVKINTINIDNLHIEKLKKHFELLSNINSVFKGLGVSEDLNCDILTEVDYRWMTFLVDCFIKNKTVKLHADNQCKINTSRVTIGNIHLLVGIESVSDDEYKIFDFVKMKAFFSECIDSQFFYVSKFHLLTKDDFLKIANIDYNELIDDVINSHEVSEYYLLKTNKLLLDMLHAWDKSGEKNAVLLNSATKLSQWLTEQSDFDGDIAKINYLQCVKRIRELRENELDILCHILDKQELSYSFKICAHILMDNFIGAKFYYSKLSPDAQSEFDSFPICSLWKNKNA